MDPNSVLPLDSLSIKNQDDPDSCFDMLKKLPPLDSLLYIEDPKPNAGFNSQFDSTSFEEFSENIEGNNTISSDTMLTEELFFSSYSSSHVAAQNNDSVSSNERCQKRTLKKSNTVTKEKELGINRWPHRKLKSLNSLIGNLKGVGMEEEVKNLEEHRILIK
ncbi:unnamed protein product [Brassica napus]|uniref:(rape) hypothetical protein n=1 Tax=Brassica napus TaxID=3708 RepID=A0A816JZU6_BRANA|nr:unnamed protein product [Brassica napus]